MNTNNSHIVKTPFFGTVARDILDSVDGQMSDGIWENSRAMEKYWRFDRVETEPDGRVVIRVSDEYGERGVTNGFKGMTDCDVLAFFAKKIKHIAQTEFADTGVNAWKRDSAVVLDYLSRENDVTVADAYFTYDTLLGRKTDGKYDETVKAKCVGQAADEETTKAETERRRRAEEAAARLTAELERLDEERRAAEKKLLSEFAARRNAILETFRKGA